jgi:hypothetical protein
VLSEHAGEWCCCDPLGERALPGNPCVPGPSALRYDNLRPLQRFSVRF